MGTLPSWDDVASGAGSVVDTVSDYLPSIDPGMAGELIGPGGLPGDFLPSMPDIDPSWMGEMVVGPGGLPGDFMPSMPDIDPSWAGELIGPGGLPGDFLPNNPGFDLPSIAELLPSIPSLPWDQLGELMAPLPFFGGGAGGGGSSGGGGAGGSY